MMVKLDVLKIAVIMYTEMPIKETLEVFVLLKNVSIEDMTNKSNYFRTMLEPTKKPERKNKAAQNMSFKKEYKKNANMPEVLQKPPSSVLLLSAHKPTGMTTSNNLLLENTPSQVSDMKRISKLASNSLMSIEPKATSQLRGQKLLDLQYDILNLSSEKKERRKRKT